MKRTVFFIAFVSVALICNAQFHYELAHSQEQKRQTTIQNQHQYQKKSGGGFDIRKLTFGGGIGMQFGDYTLVNVAPQVGYNFSDYFNAGAGLTYTYWKDDFHHNGIKYKESNNYFGFNLYGRFYPIPYIVLMVQPEVSRVWQSVENTSTGNKVKEEKFVPVCLVGGGLRLGPVTAMIQYDVVQNDRTPYGDNIFYSIGYTFGF